MSLISIAQRETYHISFVQFSNKSYGVDRLSPESYIKNNRCFFLYPTLLKKNFNINNLTKREFL